MLFGYEYDKRYLSMGSPFSLLTLYVPKERHLPWKVSEQLGGQEPRHVGDHSTHSIWHPILTKQWCVLFSLNNDVFYSLTTSWTKWWTVNLRRTKVFKPSIISLFGLNLLTVRCIIINHRTFQNVPSLCSGMECPRWLNYPPHSKHPCYVILCLSVLEMTMNNI